MSSTIDADANSALSDVLERFNRAAIPTKVAMMQARMTDGERPATKAYAHNNIIVITLRILRNVVYRRGSSSSHNIKAIMPVCKPLTARI